MLIFTNFKSSSKYLQMPSQSSRYKPDGTHAHACTHTRTHPFYGPLDFVQDYSGEPVPEPIWILLKQETVSRTVIRWVIYINLHLAPDR